MASASTDKGRRWFRRFNAPMGAAFVATLLCSVLYLGHQARVLTVPGIDAWERSVSDVRFRVRGEQQVDDDRVIIVALDDQTRREAPVLWQSRKGLAALVDKLTESEPRAIGFDAFFSSPEINLSEESVLAVRQAQEALSTEPALSAAAQLAQSALGLVEEETRGDEVFAKSVAASNRLVLALLFFLDGEARALFSDERPGLAHARFDEAVHLDQPPSLRPPQASGSVLPLYGIAQAVQHMAHVNVSHDADGAVREVPLVVQQAGRYYQAMALKLASMELGASTGYQAGAAFVHLGSKRIPLSPRGLARVNYRGGNRSFPRISAVDVMRHNGPHPRLRDRIVLVGFTDAARDKIATPYAQSYDGVELHATLFHNLIHGQLIQVGSPLHTVLALLCVGLLLSALQLRRVRGRGAWIFGVAAALWLMAYTLFSQYLFSAHNLQLALVVPSLATVTITLTALTVSLATEGREKAQIRSAFGQYLQASLVERILRDPARLRLGGQRKDLTVLFSDIRSFTRFSESLEPDLLSDFLNEYLTPMTEIVMDESGMLDKYIGDAVMAVYGAPVEIEDHAARACSSALLMLGALGPLNQSWQERGLPEVRIGIGLNTGPMSVGNMGSKARFDYTVMGDAVNLGARLESLTKSYGVSILAGEATVEAAGDHFVFRELDTVRVVGRQAEVRIYELCGTQERDAFTTEARALFAEGLAFYRAQDWEPARDKFVSFASKYPGDGPSQTLIDRIDILRTRPHDQNWDGVFQHNQK